ncbi:hypothetical protein Q7C18_02785 [Nesterenkonia sp. CL21]|uniref:hypothetical protein n=1 Tax=Nesterenkonia sp. CL21 TaxID=3064894 RepID=UPI00287B2321|nr:hypothetical protein [Nesterenkonia sp. CL21]MDS2171615.1 hypothetical protein [Nesterenkonia sp. CL21]
MPYQEHGVTKPQVIADTGVELIEEQLSVLPLFTVEQPDNFYNAADDTIMVRIPGTLPVRTYGWRNPRTEPIKTDVYSETLVPITVNADNKYSSVALTDEQKEYDLEGSFGRLTAAQTKAVAEKLDHEALGILRDLPFEVGIGVDTTPEAQKALREVGQDVFFNAFVDAGEALNRMRVPFSERVALVGSRVASDIRKSNRLDRLQGDASGGALANAVLGNYAGFTIVQDLAIPADEALIISSTGLMYWNHAPSIPEGAVKGAHANHNGVAMRWIVDYDSAYQVDRSTWSTWNGFRHVEDKLVQINEDETQKLVGEDTYFLRGAKIIFGDGTGGWEPGDGSSAGPTSRKGADADSELAKVWNGLPFEGTLPEGRDYPNVLGTVAARGGDGS